MLDLLRAAGTKATFFVLGWNAERCPSLVEDIARDGHELATHGYSHRLIYAMTPDEFREDLKRAIGAVGDAAGVRVHGHRAASFSITERCLWALDVLASEGITYDSSMFPIRHDRYGVSRQWSEVGQVSTDSGPLLEVPITVWSLPWVNLPFAGGGYFRLLPYRAVRQIARSINASGKSVVFYFHPWEIDAGIPHHKLGVIKSFRSYCNIASNERKFARLIHDFHLAPMSDLIGEELLPARVIQCSEHGKWMAA